MSNGNARYDVHQLPGDPTRKTLSVVQACAAAGVSRRTILNWLARGKVKFCRTAGGGIRVFEDSLWQRGGAPTDAVPQTPVFDRMREAVRADSTRRW
jgi:excisionase family DNA binding protein